ncbi:glucuronate isomerase [uncultured Kriegella sp.]|uniref:glucuronate isomerase n=1 Tax=uncultured Kriegella sp. TaxID=1798910 RepID=UPI0030D7303C|tara:strand:- start:28305 stop:29714 length:1410 start_codon:yes stop_codon:yes gene_type:complete
MKMTTPYIHKDFLLSDELSRSLYYDFAQQLPIIDFHNHLNPAMIASNAQPENLSKLWVMSDQYKHRAMRINGIPEDGITGNATDYDKYLNWVKTLPRTLGNPLYQWSYLELKRVFDIDSTLNESSANDIWNECQKQIDSGKLATVTLLKKFNVEVLCTSDDLLDDVSIHKKASEKGIVILPSLRTDSIVNKPEEFQIWHKILENLTQIKIKDLDSYEAAVLKRFDLFSDAGCKLADQALDSGFEFHQMDKSKVETIFKQFLSGEQLNDVDRVSLQSYLLVMVGRACAQKKWILQLHIGAQRKTSSRLKNLVGGAGGYASIGSVTNISTLVEVLDTMDKNGQLPKIILYNLNPVDNAAFASLTGSFPEDGISGKIQFGPAWWYNDHYEGIINQLKALASHGLLHNSIGMTTDSRSFVSMSRHEYFRRVFCDLISTWVKQGLLPNDMAILKELIEDVCYRNAKKWILNTGK